VQWTAVAASGQLCIGATRLFQGERRDAANAVQAVLAGVVCFDAIEVPPGDVDRRRFAGSDRGTD
jgi:hypothetical protein